MILEPALWEQGGERDAEAPPPPSSPGLGKREPMSPTPGTSEFNYLTLGGHKDKDEGAGVGG